MEREEKFEFHGSGEDEEGDEVFYEELRRQILTLTEDEDEFIPGSKPPACSCANKTSSNSFADGYFRASVRADHHWNYWEHEKASCAPAWLLNQWRSGNGTGVFIPQNIHPRRYYNQGQKKNDKRELYLRPENKNPYIQKHAYFS